MFWHRLSAFASRKRPSNATLGLTTLLAGVLFAPLAAQAGDDWERPPISYSEATPDNPVQRLMDRIDRGEVVLTFDAKLGWLPAVLKELHVPVSSQTLVFSKTSLQRSKISPKTPRALYFSDDCYIGYCQNGDVVELSAVDPNLGAVFYSVDLRVSDRPVFARHNDNCLLCHASSHTGGVPGHMVRSVYPSATGEPVLSLGSHRIDHSSRFSERWGGWYVTGRHGDQVHLGNVTIKERETRRENIDREPGQNLVDLSSKFDTSKYLSPHSDLVALMVLEHQAEGHNRITRANFETRLALDREAQLNRELKEPADKRWDSTNSRIRSAGEALVKYLLFAEEAPLAGPISGTTSFAAEYAALGPRDPKGRSLRDFDLDKRLLRYPCSPLVYTEAFDALPSEMATYVYGRLRAILRDGVEDKAFARLSAVDRQAIDEILTATKPAYAAFGVSSAAP